MLQLELVVDLPDVVEGRTMFVIMHLETRMTWHIHIKPDHHVRTAQATAVINSVVTYILDSLSLHYM